MSSTYYRCDECGETIFGGNMDEEGVCPYCGGNAREAYTTSGAWDDPDVEKRDWEADNK